MKNMKWTDKNKKMSKEVKEKEKSEMLNVDELVECARCMRLFHSTQFLFFK